MGYSMSGDGKRTRDQAFGREVFIIIQTLLFLCAAAACRAETIKLKNGTVVRGKIVAETSQIVQVQVYGVTVPYFRDEVVSIEKDGETVSDPQEELPVVEEETPAAKDKKGRQKDINGPLELKTAVRSARKHIKNKEFKAAFLDLETVRLKYPDNPDLNAALGSVCLAERRYDQCVQCFEKAVAGAGAESPYWLGLGKAYFLAEKFDDSERVLQKIAASGQKENADTYLFLGRIFLRKKQYAEAFTSLKKSSELEKVPSAETLHYMGWAQYGLNNYKEAVALWEKAMAEGYPSTRTYFTIGRCYLKTGDYKKAAEYFEKSLESPDIDKGKVYERLGRVYLGAGDRGKAAEYFRKASALGNMEADDALREMQR